MKRLVSILSVVAILGLVVCQQTSLQINSIPAGAEIWLNEESTGAKTDTMLAKLDAGEHMLKLVMENYHDWDTTITLESGKTDTVMAEFKIKTGMLQLNSTPKGAEVWINEENTGKKTNVLFEALPAGTHKLTLKMKGYKDMDTTFTIIADSTVTLKLKLK
ncbi:PEGA domain-containing protein [candidate division WOR-3 bacterium]|nr:PEGA domain-containing protein [candidate division WOR-3 bacterium]